MRTEHAPLAEYAIKLMVNHPLGVYTGENELLAKNENEARFIGLWMASDELSPEAQCKINCQPTGERGEMELSYTLPN